MNTHLFNGHFTKEICRMIVEKRKSLKMSQQALAEYLGCARECVSHWENSRANTCHPSSIIPIQLFLSGEYDEKWQTEKEIDDLMFKLTRKFPLCIHSLLFRSIKICKQPGGADLLLPRLFNVYFASDQILVQPFMKSPKKRKCTDSF